MTLDTTPEQRAMVSVEILISQHYALFNSSLGIPVNTEQQKRIGECVTACSGIVKAKILPELFVAAKRLSALVTLSLLHPGRSREELDLANDAFVAALARTKG